MKIANIIGFLLFLLFAWFNRNDIDPAIYEHASGIDSLLWFLFYLLIAGLFLIAVFRVVPMWLLIVAALACIAEMALSGPGLWENLFGDQEFNMTKGGMSAADPRVELSREFFGALIAFAAVAFLWWQRKRGTAKAG